MHLTIVSPFPPAITGIGQYGYHVTRALARSGYFSRITVLAGSQVHGTSPNHLGLTEVEYCWTPGQANARQVILSRVKQLNPDLVWFNFGASIFGKSPWLNLSGLLLPTLVQKMGYPTVLTLHELVELADLRALNSPGGPFAAWGARLLTSMATRADMVCLTMRHYADWLADRQVECRYVPIGAYYPPELLDDSLVDELLFFTTLAPYKGLELLLEAHRQLRTEWPGLRLTIAGTEHPRFPDYTRRLKEQCGEMEGIQWLGQVAEDDVINLFRRAKIVVLPYTASTGASSVMYQAASWGRAIAGSNLNEMRWLAKENGLRVEFFENRNVESLRTTIRNLIASPALRQEQVENNFRAIQNMRIELTCHRYLQAFNRALEKRNSPVRIPLSLPVQLESV